MILDTLSYIWFPPCGTVEVKPVVRVAAAHGDAVLAKDIKTIIYNHNDQRRSICKRFLKITSSPLLFGSPSPHCVNVNGSPLAHWKVPSSS